MFLSSIGGIAGAALLLVSLFSLTIIIERCFFWQSTIRKQKLLSDIVIKNCFSEHGIMENIRENDRGHLVTIIAKQLDIFKMDNLEELNEDLDLSLKIIEEKLKKHDSILATIVAISPLLGLLGTVLGLIRSMKGLTLTALADSNLSVMAGISEALISTAFGLTIAVVTLIATNFFRGLRRGELRKMRSLAKTVQRKYIQDRYITVKS